MNTQYEKIKELVSKYPNDMMLGKQVRDYVLTKEKEARDYKLRKLSQRSE